MTIKEIAVSNYGSIHFFQTSFSHQITVVETRQLSEVSAAIEIVLCSKTVSSLPCGWVRSDTEIKAEVCVGEDTFYVLAKAGCIVPYALVIQAVDAEGQDVTCQYRTLLSHCLEQDVVESFDGYDKSIPLRLCWYRNDEDYEPPGKLASNSEHIATTKTFRARLARYIKAFEPESINNQKNYRVSVNGDGSFKAFYPGSDDDIYLSETEEKLFLYICFLNIAEFWGDIEAIRNLHNVNKPLLIKNFIEYLDESVEINNLIKRTLTLNRQIIVVTLPVANEKFNEWIGERS